MRRIANSQVWIGNAGDLREPRIVLDEGIAAVIELADNEQFVLLPRDLIRLRFPLSDSGENPAWLLQLAVHSTLALLRASVPTLVACSCGLNRSVCLAAVVLATLENRPFEEVLLEVASAGPADVSPGLLTQFQIVVTNDLTLPKGF